MRKNNYKFTPFILVAFFDYSCFSKTKRTSPG